MLSNVLEIHFLEEISGKIFGNRTGTGTGYPAGTGFSRISGRFLVVSKLAC